jgi:hypothetical protein
VGDLIGYTPNVDAVQEIQVLTGNANAEFGNGNGAIVNMTTKSGTNQFHGNVFEFPQNDKLNANFILQQPERREKTGAAPEHFRRNAGRAYQERSLVFLRGLPGDADRQ